MSSARRNELLGRATELTRLRAMCATPGPVTVHGPGGAGKTRLVAELVAIEPAAVSVPLAEVTDAEWMVATVAGALGLGAATVGSLGAALQHRGRSLLVLDNLEQLGVDGARVVSDLVTAAPELTLVVTSRVRLELRGERTLPVGPLEADAALALLLARVRERAPDFPDHPALPELCARLDHLPLALELAAARLPTLGVDGVMHLLGRRLDLLADRGPDRPDHHRSLRTAVEGSWSLLTREERRILSALALLPGPLQIEDTAFAGGEVEVGLALASLTDASLLRVVVDASARATWHHYETVRAFALEQLPPDDPARGRLVAWLVQTADRLRAALCGPGVDDAVATFLRLRSALIEAVERAERDERYGDLVRLVGAMDTLVHQVGPGTWRERMLQRVVALCEPGSPPSVEAVVSLAMTTVDPTLAERLASVDPTASPAPLRARVQVAVAKSLFDRGRMAEAAQVAQEAAASAVTETRGFLGACWVLGGIRAAMGDLERARAAWSEGLERARLARSPVDEGLFLGQVGSAAMDQDDPDAMGYLRAAVELLGRHHDYRRSVSLIRIAEILVDRDDAMGALEAASEAATVMRSTGQLRLLGYAEALVARAHEASGRTAEALDAYERARGGSGHPVVMATIEAWGARALADADRLADAEALFGRASPVLARSGTKLAPLSALIGVHLALLRARRARREGRDPEPWLAEARQVLAAHPPEAMRASETRSARRAAAERLAADTGGDGILTPADGAWIVWGTHRLELGTRHAIRRVWLALVDARDAGEPRSVEELFAAGWPGESARQDAARDRVYHAVATLRKGGLGDALLRTEGGWVLDPGVPLRFV